MTEYQTAMQRQQFHHHQMQQMQLQLPPSSGGMPCYTVPECVGDDDEDLDDKWNSSSGVTTSTATTEEEELGDETPIPTPTATIGAYHPPNNGPPQIGYFVPLTPIFFRSPQFRKR